MKTVCINCCYICVDSVYCNVWCSIYSAGLQTITTVCTASCHALRSTGQTASNSRQLHSGMCSSQVRHRLIPTEGQKHVWCDTDQLWRVSHDGSLQQAITQHTCSLCWPFQQQYRFPAFHMHCQIICLCLISYQFNVIELLETQLFILNKARSVVSGITNVCIEKFMSAYCYSHYSVVAFTVGIL